jgi:hypothetical protein
MHKGQRRVASAHTVRGVWIRVRVQLGRGGARGRAGRGDGVGMVTAAMEPLDLVCEVHVVAEGLAADAPRRGQLLLARDGGADIPDTHVTAVPRRPLDSNHRPHAACARVHELVARRQDLLAHVDAADVRDDRLGRSLFLDAHKHIRLRERLARQRCAVPRLCVRQLHASDVVSITTALLPWCSNHVLRAGTPEHSRRDTAAPSRQ